MKLCESGGPLAADMGVPVSKMEESIAAHYHPSLRTAQDPDGGPFPAYPSGKSRTKLLARRVQERSFTTVGERAPMSAVARQPVSIASETGQSSFQSYSSDVLSASCGVFQ